MDEELFDDLCESIEEAGKIRRGEAKASRVFTCIKESEDTERTKMIIEMDVTKPQGLALQAMFEYWNYLGNIGSSRKVGFYVDGDGNFQPNCNVKLDASVELTDEMKEAAVVADDDGDRTYDFDPIAWMLDKEEHPEDWPSEEE